MEPIESRIVLDIVGSKKLIEDHNILSNLCRGEVEIHNVPLSVARNVYSNYPNKRREISTTNLYEDINPDSIATSLRCVGYEAFLRYIYIYPRGFEHAKEDKKLFREKEMKEDLDSFHVNRYFTNTKEGLIILLTELQDYYLGKNNPNLLDTDSQVKKQNELYSKVVNELIKHINPYQTTEEWIEDKKIQLPNRRDDKQDNQIKELLTKFDSVINPFAYNECGMLEPSEYLDKVDLSFRLKTNNNGYFIRDRETSTTIHCFNDTINLGYSIYFDNNSSDIHVQHSIGGLQQFCNAGYEQLSICEFSKDPNKRSKDIYYDLVNNTIGQKTKTAQIYSYKDLLDKRAVESHFERPLINSSQKEEVIKVLTQAIEVAESITLNNMVKEKGRVLKKNKI